MTFLVKHAKVSAKADGGDTTFVRPSDWNAGHTLTCASNVVLGLDGSAPGAVIEIPCTAAGRSVIGAVDVAAILVALGITLPTTGDLQPTFKTVAPATWLMLDDGTIGNLTSGASSRANADTQALFVLIWAIPIADALIFNSDGTPSTRGGTALLDYNANKRLSLPKALGRALALAGTGAGLTARTLGHVVGEENHTPTLAEMFTHTHVDSGHTHGKGAGSPTTVANFASGGVSATAVASQGATDPGTANLATMGSSTPFNVMQPTTFINVMVKL